MPKLGQHFLKNRGALTLIARALDIHNGDIVLEIGPGHGELTEELKTQNFPPKADPPPAEKLETFKIITIEKDPRLVEFLKKRFADDPRIEILEGDALKIIPRIISVIPVQAEIQKTSETQESWIPAFAGMTEHDWKLTGNIPYYLTGKLLRIIGELAHAPATCVFTIQKEVAARITAQCPQMNRLAASVGFWARAEIIGHLPRTDFNPPPNVDSSIIKLTTLPAALNADRESYYRAVRALFSQPRKTILNNLVGGITEKGKIKEEITTRLETIGIRPDLRPQNLTIENIARIAQIF